MTWKKITYALLYMLVCAEDEGPHTPGYMSPGSLSCAGASDAMSCVATILEAARTIVHNPNITLQAPVILLLNGGEETLLQVTPT
jgi:hypothetical protein